MRLYKNPVNYGPTTDRVFYVLQKGELWADSTTYQMFVGDGSTPGGIPVSPGDCVVSINNGGSTLLGCMAVKPTAGGVAPAQADSVPNGSVAGLVLDASAAPGNPLIIVSSGIVEAPTSQWDAVAGTSGGLVEGAFYFLSASSPGSISSIPAGSGVNTLIGLALSPTQLALRIQPPIQL